MSATDRAGAAEEVTRLREALISLGNTRAGEKRLFGGQQTGASPFDAAGVYTGDANAQEVILEGNTVVEVTIAGDELLRGAAGGPDILLEVENLANGLSTNTTLDIQNGIAALDDSISHLLEFRAEVGARMNLTVQLDRHFETVETGLVADISGLEEADPIEAFSELMRTNTAYETVMQVAVNSRTRNIFELL